MGFWGINKFPRRVSVDSSRAGVPAGKIRAGVPAGNTCRVFPQAVHNRQMISGRRKRYRRRVINGKFTQKSRYSFKRHPLPHYQRGR